MPKKLIEYVPAAFLIIFTIIFFHKLFIPQLSVFATPGDIAYFNYPLKNFLAESLKNHELPIWTNLIGTGFPVLADSPIGAFYLPNLIIFYLFPMPLAFNLHYIFIFMTSTFGIYLLSRHYKFSINASVYAALAFGFSGFFIARIIHTSFIQLASLLPFLFLFTDRFAHRPNLTKFLAISVIASQMIFIGYPQGFLYAVFFSYIYLVLNLYFNKQKAVQIAQKTLLYTICIMFGLLLSAAQILPTIEMVQYSTRSAGLDTLTLFQNSGSAKILLFFINPFIYGNLSLGTLKSLQGVGYFWENVAYSGLLTSILALFSPFLWKKNRTIGIIFLMLVLLSILLALGRFGPAHIIFSIPPFSFFKIPARFLFLTSFSLSMLAAISLTSFSKIRLLKLLPALILIFLIFDIFKNWFTFNTYVEKNKYLNTPETAIYAKESLTENSRISSLWPSVQKPTEAASWEENKEAYVKNFSFMTPNVNMVYKIPSIDFYTSLSTRRLNLLRELGFQNIKLTKDKEVEINDVGINILKIQAVHEIFSPFKVKGQDIVDEKILLISEENPVYAYKIQNALQRFRFVTKVETANSVNELIAKLADENINFGETAILEGQVPEFQNEASTYTITNVTENKNTISLTAKTDGEGYLIIADTYYPGWKATLNGESTEILPANINHRAVKLTKGESLVELKYDSSYLKIGLWLSSISYLVIILLLAQKFSRGLSTKLRSRSKAR